MTMLVFILWLRHYAVCTGETEICEEICRPKSESNVLLFGICCVLSTFVMINKDR